MKVTNTKSKSLLRKKFSLVPSPRKPDWIKIKHSNTNTDYTKTVIHNLHLTTVCEEALCPNLNECWSMKHATFMILGDVCTRSCSFCNIKTGRTSPIDNFEPFRIASAVRALNLNHVVITSVDRDDLDDGGANQFFKTVIQIKSLSPRSTIEILTPDFRNKNNALKIISNCPVDVFNHNLETVSKLYKEVRPGADYFHSLSLLKKIKDHKPNVFTKSGIMIGLGESTIQIESLMNDLRNADVDFITIGQYLRPTMDHHPVVRYHDINYFNFLKDMALDKKFKLVASSPFTRSSFHADEDFKLLKTRSVM